MPAISDNHQRAFEAIEKIAQKIKDIRLDDAEIKKLADSILSTCRYKSDVGNEIRE